MYFAKNEIIELSNDVHYLVTDTAFLDNEAYYEVVELDKNDNEIGSKKIITAKNDNGKLYVDDRIAQEIVEKLQEIFE